MSNDHSNNIIERRWCFLQHTGHLCCSSATLLYCLHPKATSHWSCMWSIFYGNAAIYRCYFPPCILTTQTFEWSSDDVMEVSVSDDLVDIQASLLLVAVPSRSAIHKTHEAENHLVYSISLTESMLTTGSQLELFFIKKLWSHTEWHECT